MHIRFPNLHSSLKAHLPALLSMMMLGVFAILSFLYQHTFSFHIFAPDSGFTVVLDAGHGGADPGKVSSSGVKEKDINLQIALKCQSILEQNGIHVILTRNQDTSLAEPGSDREKASDLQKRKEIITNPQVDCAVSIHQNSYPDTSQHGSQVFYHPSNQKGKLLASLIQEQTRTLTALENHRQIKENSDYYLLRDNPVPTVIAEICFLSNPSEAEMITEESCQEKAAFAIAMGIMQYLNS